MQKNEPRLIVLPALDGGCSHCVSIVNDWIFDSSLKYALPFNKKSLDECCGKGATFIGHAKGWHFKIRGILVTGKDHSKKKK